MSKTNLVIMENSFLRSRSYYEDLYDRHTVETCLWWENNFLKDENDGSDHSRAAVRHMMVYFKTGERYINREGTINEWMSKDEERDRIFNDTPIPENNRCVLCQEPMELDDKFLFDEGLTFYFRCKCCSTGAKITSGIRTNIIPWQCPSCKKRLKSKSERKKGHIITRKNCSFCGHNSEDIFDLTPPKPKKKPSKKEKLELAENKLRFCLMDEEGQDYIRAKQNLEEVSKFLKEFNPDEAGKEPAVKIMSTKEAQTTLKKSLKKCGCERIKFSDPDTTRNVIFEFKAIDGKGLNDSELKKEIKKELKDTFNGTNWNLMSEGPNCRLGVVEGRMRGKESSMHSQETVTY